MSIIQIISADGKRVIDGGKIQTINDATEDAGDCDCCVMCNSCNATYTVVVSGTCPEIDGTYVMTRLGGFDCTWRLITGTRIATLTIDDVSGPPYWLHIVNNVTIPGTQVENTNIPMTGDCPTAGSYTLTNLFGCTNGTGVLT